MIRPYAAIILLSTLIAVSHGGDWLDGGYVGSGNYGEVRQYFTDPIFYTKVPTTSSSAYYPALDRKVFLREPIACEPFQPHITYPFNFENPLDL